MTHNIDFQNTALPLESTPWLRWRVSIPISTGALNCVRRASGLVLTPYPFL